MEEVSSFSTFFDIYNHSDCLLSFCVFRNKDADLMLRGILGPFPAKFFPSHA